MYRSFLSIIIYIVFFIPSAQAEYVSKETFSENDLVKHTDWGLWVTKYDLAMFDEVIWNPAQDMATALRALGHIRRGYRNDYSKSERRQIKQQLEAAENNLVCITEYPNVIGNTELQRINEGQKVYVPTDLEFSDNRLRGCEQIIAVPDKPIVFNDLDCIYYNGKCHLQWVYTNNQTGEEEFLKISLSFHYPDYQKNLNVKLYDLDLIRISGAIEFFDDYWYRELPLTQLTNVEVLIEEAVEVANTNYELDKTKQAKLNDVLKLLGNKRIQNYYQKTEYKSGYLMIHPEEALNADWGQIAYQRIVDLIPQPEPVVDAEVRKKFVSDSVRALRMAEFCVDYRLLTGFDKKYINTQFANDPKNDLTIDELNSLGVPELALLEMLVRGNDGNDYCAMIQLLLTSGSSFFE
jgi:hypothetical protein